MARRRNRRRQERHGQVRIEQSYALFATTPDMMSCYVLLSALS